MLKACCRFDGAARENRLLFSEDLARRIVRQFLDDVYRRKERAGKKRSSATNN
jgi:hypothetical protein